MVLRIALFLIMALGIAGFGMVAWIGIHSPDAPPPPGAAIVAPPARVVALGAAHLVRAGELLKPDDLMAVELTTATAPQGILSDTPHDRSALFGAMLRSTLEAGTAILATDVMRVSDRGFLAAVLGPGMRAASVGVDAVSGTAGLIWPGDHVDVILTQTTDDTTVGPGRRISGETVLHDVRVIAIDQALIEGAAPEAVPGVPTAQTRTVTFEVSSADAERVAVANRLGKLSLSLIAAAPGADGKVVASAPPVTWASDVSAALRQAPRTDATTTLHLFEGSAEGKEFHF